MKIYRERRGKQRRTFATEVKYTDVRLRRKMTGKLRDTMQDRPLSKAEEEKGDRKTK
jgi:hypothetical protein